jgi:Ca2+-binding RTX toxin-like protein
VEGQAGTDTLFFNGANVAENIELFANGGRLLFFRNVASVVMDCDDVETVQFQALGGADVITVNDLSATGVTTVNVNLAASGGAGDAAADNVIVTGTSANDSITIAQAGGAISVSGLATTVNISGSEAANDRVTINTLGGDDVMDASTLAAGFISITADGGIDDDVLIGSAGIDTLFGGDGDDVLIGGPGVDVLDGGPGSNVVIQD